MLIAGLFCCFSLSLSPHFSPSLSGRELEGQLIFDFVDFFILLLKTEMAGRKESGVLGREDFK